MVRYTIPTTILAMAIGTVGSSVSKGVEPRNRKLQGGKSGNSKGKGGSNGRSGSRGLINTIYTMSNNSEGNEVVIYSSNPETGELTAEGRVATGGKGGGNDLFPVGYFLDSTDSLIVHGECVLAANAGSGTITSFRIDSASQITHMGEYATNGNIPTSIAARGDLVYAMNSEGNGSIQGYNITPGCDLTPIGGPIDLMQDIPADNVPVGLLGNQSPGQVGFTTEGQLLVLLKMTNGSDPGSLNFYDILDNGTAQFVEQISTEVIFAYAFEILPQGGFIVIGAIPGDDVRLYNADKEVVDISSAEAMGGCWIRYNPTNQCMFESVTTDVPQGGIVSFKLEGDELELAASQAAQQPFPADMVLSEDNAYLYATTFGPESIYVYSQTSECGLNHVQTVTGDGENGALGLARYSGNGAQVSSTKIA